MSAGAAPFVVLIGPPGVGKSSVAAGIAERTGREYVDTDALVEEREGRTVADIFVDSGEEHFRAAERDAVLDSLTREGIVLALGGGAPMTPAIAEALVGHRVVFLDVGIADAAKRIGFDRSRPLLSVNPRQSWIRTMEARRPTYESLAVHRVDTAGRDVDAVVTETLDRLGGQA